METRSYALLFAALAVGTSHGQDIRSATADNLNLPGAWVDATPPTNLQIATWDAASTLANTLGANLAWGGLNVSAASGAVSISGANTLAAGAINLGATNLSITTSTAPNSLAFTSLTGSGNFTVSNGIQTLGLTSFNTANALNFNGTLTLRGGNAATTPAAIGGSFFYLGRTGITQAAGTSFALDTGASATNAKDVIIDNGAWGGKTIQLSSLTGFGSLRRDSGAGVQVATIDVNQAVDTVFNGMVLSHISIPNTDIRRLDLTKRGTGSLTLAGIVGKQTQSAGGDPSNINLTVSGGTLVLTAANTRTGSATISASGTLQAGNGGTTGVIGGSTIANEGALVYDYGSGATLTDANAISGSGTLTKKGAGALALTGTSLLAGTTTVEAGLLRIGGALSTSPVTVASGASIGAGTHAAVGTGLVKSLSLTAGSASTFRAGATFDQLIVSDADGLVAAGAHVITAVFNGGLNPGDKVAIIDYTGTFTGFANLSLAPGSRFSLSHNLANTTIDLEYSGSSVIWTGGDGNWDLSTTPNWTLGGNPTNFLVGDAAVFNDTASTGNVVLVGIQTPSSVTIDNSTLAYTLSGGTLGGTGTLTKQGNGSATITAATSYTGTTFIDGGTLTFGDGATSGQIGSGPVDILIGATLRINRSDLLDYKTNPRLRTVSGAGDIAIDGGGTVFNYTGTGVGFADANSWTGFSGNLTVKNGSEFQTIRNGSTAMGTGDVILGDATTSGKLSQIEGNWTWTNDIILTGADNRIINRSSTGADRLLKLQGVISGSGALTFEDAAATMTNNQRGFILTGENTLDGALTIPAGVPVRVGGVPGNTDASQNGAGISGSLGSASVVNEGILTFSRTNVHTVANTISGAGQAFIGLSTGSAAQVVTFTGTKSYSGPTIVRSGTLLVNTSLPNSPVVVEAAGTLGGTGTLGIASSVSGTLAPGDAVGTLTSTADIALENNSKVAWQIGDWNGSAGTGYDTLSVPSLTIGAIAATPITIVITGESLVNFSETAKTFTLATTSGGVSGLDTGEIIVDDTDAPGTGTWSVQVAGNNLQLVYSLGNTYDAFESANGISGAGDNTDSDGDGIPNGIEFVIGGDPSGPDSDSSALLPTASVDATNLSFVFRRTDASAGFDPVVEYSSTLTGWTVAQGGVGDVLITEDNNFYGTGTDRVTVVIPRALAAGSTLFARLRIDIP